MVRETKTLPKGRIVVGDCIAKTQELPAESVDMVFADPPYNLQLHKPLHRPDATEVIGVREDWDKYADFAAYDDFTQRWAENIRRVMKADATLWVIGSYHNIYRIGSILQNLGFWILNDIIWVKNNPTPNFKGTRFTNAHEILLWCAKSRDSRYYFNYQAMKMLNEDLQMRSDWHFPICAGKERLKDDEGSRLHPTQKPESLLQRVILSSTRKQDLVLEPFAGTATACAVAKRLGRQWIGIEQQSNYASAARKRLRSVVPLADEALHITEPKAKEKRIPFGHLVESGIVPAGETLISECKQHKVQVQADGSIVWNDGKERISGSIHQVGAHLKNRPCNGWDYWQMASSSHSARHISLDNLRRQYRKG